MNKLILSLLAVVAVGAAVLGTSYADMGVTMVVTETNVSLGSDEYKSIISGQIERSNDNFQYAPSELFTSSMWNKIMQSMMMMDGNMMDKP